MNFVSKYGDDAIDEEAKLATTQLGSNLIKLSRRVYTTCRQAVLSGSTCEIPQVMIDTTQGINNLSSELRRFAGKILNLVEYRGIEAGLVGRGYVLVIFVSDIGKYINFPEMEIVMRSYRVLSDEEIKKYGLP